MKKIYLLTSLALSMSLFAQDNHSLSKINQSVQQIRSSEFIKTSKDKALMQTGFAKQGTGTTPFEPLTLIAIYDSLYTWQWDTIALQWKKNEKIVNIVYGTNQNMLSGLQKNWNGNSWHDSVRNTNTYDVNINKTGTKKEAWTGSAWVNQTQSTYTYNANNKQTVALNQTWGGTAWTNTNQHLYTFDVNNNQTSDLYQTWSGTAWTNTNRYTYTYDANHNKLSALYETYSGTWTNSSQTTYTYDVNNNQTSSLTQSWTGSAWTNSSQTTNTFNASNKETSSFGQYWSGIAWTNSSQETWTYDANNNNTNLTFQGYNGAAWITFILANYTYDVNNLMKSEVIKIYNNTGTKVTSGDSILLYYHAAVGINELSANNEQIKVYPNPNDGNFVIETSTSAKQVVNVFDVNGKLVLSQAISGKTAINSNSLTDGIYFVKIKTVEGFVTKKIVVQH